MCLLGVSLLVSACGPGTSVDYPAAPALSLSTPDGQLHTIPATGETRVRLVLFWASWCPYCKALMPHLQSMLDQHGRDRLQVLAVNFREDGKPLEWLESQGFQFEHLPQGDATAESWNVASTPGLFVVDQQDRLVFNLYEVLTEDARLRHEDGSHAQKAARRAPYWAARIRQVVNELL